MEGEQQLLGVIEDIYAAATDADRMSTLGAQIAPLFGTDSSLVFSIRKGSIDLRPVPTLAGLLSFTSDMQSWGGEAYRDYYHDRNEWFSRGIKKPLPAIVLGHELISDRTLEMTEFYADWCRRIDIFHIIGSSFELGGDLVGAIGFHRGRRFGAYSESDRGRMAVLLPHLQRSLQIYSRLQVAEHAHAVTRGVLDSLALGIIVAAPDGCVLRANNVAERVLQKADGLTVNKGRLRSKHARSSAALAKAIGEAADTSAGQGTSAGGVVSLPCTSGGSIVALVSPLRLEKFGYGPAQPAALVVFSDPDAVTEIPAETLARVFGLTPAESRLVVSLLAGETLSSYAELNSLSLNTAKTQLQQIFQKTGCSRQIDLIRAILSDPVLKLGRNPK